MKGAAPKAQITPQPLSGVHWPLNKVSLWLRRISFSLSHVPPEEPRVGPMDGADTAMEIAHHGHICFAGTAPSCQEGTTD